MDPEKELSQWNQQAANESLRFEDADLDLSCTMIIDNFFPILIEDLYARFLISIWKTNSVM